MKELVFISIYILFLFAMYRLYFRSSLVEPFEEEPSNNVPDCNPLIQIGKNSSHINNLRERIDKINPEKILDKLNSMDASVKTNADNINALRDAQSNQNDTTDDINENGETDDTDDLDETTENDEQADGDNLGDDEDN